MSTIRVNAIQNTSGVEVYTAKAWVNFNGTGTVAIRAAGNVSSITDNGTGNYTVNFAAALPDANYSVVGSCRQLDSGAAYGASGITWAFGGSGELASSSCSFRIGFKGNTVALDTDLISVAIFR